VLSNGKRITLKKLKQARKDIMRSIKFLNTLRGTGEEPSP